MQITAQREQWAFRVAGLDDEARVSVAEEVMERGGHGGQTFHIPVATVRDAEPLGLEPHALQRQHSKAAEDFVEQALGHRIRVEPRHWDLRGGGQAVTDGANYIGIADTDTNAMTLLHEIAHIKTRTQHGLGGHGPEFKAAVSDLYRRHISPAAADTFDGIAHGG